MWAPGLPPARGFWISQIVVKTGGGSAVADLLRNLSYKELSILHKNPDLQRRVHDIARHTRPQLLHALSKDFGLTVSDCMTGDYFVGQEQALSDLIPEWLNPLNFGFWVPGGVEDVCFIKWARNFLMMEVRTNLWIRYLEHKRKTK